MTRTISHCRKLKYEYDPERAECLFEDGTIYTVREMIFLSKQKLTDEDMDAIHAVKRIFGGVIDTGLRTRRAAAGPDWLAAMGRRFARTRPIERIRK